MEKPNQRARNMEREIAHHIPQMIAKKVKLSSVNIDILERGT